MYVCEYIKFELQGKLFAPTNVIGSHALVQLQKAFDVAFKV